MSGWVVSTSRMTRAPPPAGHVHVDEDDVGVALADHLDRGVDLRRAPDDDELVAQLGAHAGEEELMVVDEEDARSRGAPVIAALPRHHELDLGALARRAANGRPCPRDGSCDLRSIRRSPAGRRRHRLGSNPARDRGRRPRPRSRSTSQ